MSTKKITSTKIISSRLKELISEQPIKKGVLARKIGVTAGFITQLLNGESGASDQTIKSLSREFLVTEEWLAYGTGEKKFEVTHIFEPEQKKAQRDPFDELILGEVQKLSKNQKADVIKYLTENFSAGHNLEKPSNKPPL